MKFKIIAAMIAVIVINTISQDGTVEALPGYFGSLCGGSGSTKVSPRSPQTQNFKETDHQNGRWQEVHHRQDNYDRHVHAIRENLALSRAVNHQNYQHALQEAKGYAAEMQNEVTIGKYGSRNR